MKSTLTAILSGVLLLAVTAASAPQPQPPVPDRTVTRPGVQPPRTPPRDRQAEDGIGTGRIAGRVVAAETGLPLRRAHVRLSSAELRGRRLATTDLEGRYEFRELPAGRYSVSASRSGYVSLRFGQRRPFEAGRPIELADGQTLEDVDFPLPRASVIAGRVVDEFGEPVSEVTVRALRVRRSQGRRRLQGVGRRVETDDLGSFRLYGLPPGQYYVSATLRVLEGPETVGDDTTGYAPTYYPGTPDASQAQLLSLGLGQEIGSVDFPLFVTRTARVSGRVIGSDGRPVSRGSVGLEPHERSLGLRSWQAWRLERDGRFTISNVPPGEYTVRYRGFSGESREDREREFALANITVTGADIEGLVLRATIGASAAGVVVFEGLPAGARPERLERLIIFAESVDPDLPIGGNTARVDDDLAFELTGLFGPRLIRISGARGWQLKAVRLGETDITDTPLTFEDTDRVEDLRLVLTNRMTALTGTVRAGDRPATDYVVLVFAEDPRRRAYPSRFTRMARPDQRGVFELEGLPPARYLAVATEWIEEGIWTDPEFLARIEPYATRVTLGEGERTSIALSLQLLQPSF